MESFLEFRPWFLVWQVLELWELMRMRLLKSHSIDWNRHSSLQDNQSKHDAPNAGAKSLNIYVNMAYITTISILSKAH